MTDAMRKLIDETKRLDAAASAGPWHERDAETENGYSTSAVSLDSADDDGLSPADLLMLGRNIAVGLNMRNAALIADYRTAAPVLAAEVERLDARLADIEEDARRVLADSCAPDERHCSCVPHLRARLAEVERERDEALLTLAAEQGRQEGAPSKRWHYVGNEDGFDEERGEWRRRDGAVKVWWDNGRWIWGRRAQPGVYVAERGQPDDQPARVAMLAADAATG